MKKHATYKTRILAACTAAFLLALPLLAGCHDNLYGDIINEVRLIGGINGNITSIADCSGKLYLAAAHKGYLYQRDASSDGFAKWQRLSLPDASYYALWVRPLSSSSIQVLAASKWSSDSYGVMRLDDSYTIDYDCAGDSWSAKTEVNYNDVIGNFTQQVTSAGGYSITEHNGINGTVLTGSSKFGYIHSIALCKDYLLLGTDNGLWMLPEGNISEGALVQDIAHEDGFANIKTTEIPLIYVVDSTKNYAATTIYVCQAPAGTSTQYQKNGLYAIYRSGEKANQWNQDGTSSGN